jgi:GH43 family beta-xylosidase
MKTRWQIEGKPVLPGKPEHGCETVGLRVDERPSVLRRNGRIFISCSASATDHNHAMGLLWAVAHAGLPGPGSWTKSAQPVLRTCYDHGVDGRATTASPMPKTTTPSCWSFRTATPS